MEFVRHPLAQLLLLVGFAFALRAHAFQLSVIDWDETTYLIVGRGLLDGLELYTGIWDSKPPLIYWLAAGVQLLPIDPVVAIRATAAFASGLTGWLILRLVLALESAGHQAGWIAALLLIVTQASLSPGFSPSDPWGLEANTELFFMPFSALALLLLLRGSGRIGMAAAAGVSIGTALLIKQVVVVELLALGVLIVLRRGAGWRRDLLTFAAGCAIPTAIWLGLSVVQGEVDLFWQVITAFQGTASVTQDLSRALQFAREVVTDLPLLCLLALLGVVAAYVQGARAAALVGAGWLVAATIGAVLPGGYFVHYRYPMYAPLAFCAGMLFLYAPLATSRRRLLVGVLLLGHLLYIPYSLTVKYRDGLLGQPDLSRQVVSFLRERMTQDERIFVDNWHHAAYLLLDRLPPTRYVHPSVLFMHAARFGVDQRATYAEIFAQRPRYVIYWRQPYMANYVTDFWAYYRPLRRFGTNVFVAELKR